MTHQTRVFPQPKGHTNMPNSQLDKESDLS